MVLRPAADRRPSTVSRGTESKADRLVVEADDDFAWPVAEQKQERAAVLDADDDFAPLDPFPQMPYISAADRQKPAVLWRINAKECNYNWLERVQEFSTLKCVMDHLRLRVGHLSPPQPLQKTW